MFQPQIIKKYIRSQSQENIQIAFEIFQQHFQTESAQNKIKTLKEEQYQEGFLRDLFGEVFGYTLPPKDNYNLITELKNPTNSQKVDGAILNNNSPLAVIELKSMKTTDLGLVEAQAFGYKNHHKNCRYVMISNFQKLRFYIDNAVDYLEFDLFTLNKENFELLYLLLQKDNLLNDTPLKLKKESLSKEEDITHALYKDYVAFKNGLFDSLLVLNPDKEPLQLYKKTQKLLDRFLFIFFGEDRGLLPPNAIRIVLEDWEKLKELDEDIPLYNRFKKYFGYLDTGFKGKKYDVFAYNGGLFKPDEYLDNLKIDDKILYIHTAKLADYNFESDVDVDILGHIFENSLNDIEEMTAKLTGETFNSKDTKRKKDGVFYTPRYITHYIVQQTLGKLCEEKKKSLEWNDEAFAEMLNVEKPTKKQKDLLNQLGEKITDYQEWLKNLTICDPACGSGAFLNAAFDFLAKEHQYLAELYQKLFNDTFMFQDIDKEILENNLFGVDINEESVEIAKLALWLKTAKKNRKLNNLNGNIKCGNSLMNAQFNWQKEFSQVFEKGGFDVVIGNPPYVQLQKIKDQSLLLKDQNYQSFESTGDLYCLFYERGVQLLKAKGLLGYITSNKWMRANYGKYLRNYLLKETNIKQLVDLGSGVFESATVDSNILILQKRLSKYKDLLKENKKFNQLTHQQKIDELKNNSQLKQTMEMQNNPTIKKIMEMQNNPIIKKISEINKQLSPLIENIEKNKQLLPIADRIDEIEKHTSIIEILDIDENITISKLFKVVSELSEEDYQSLLDKAKEQKKFAIADLSKEKDISILDKVNEKANIVDFDENEVWVNQNPIEVSIKNKIQSQGIPLKDWDIAINYGVKTGFNDAFVIDGETKDRLIKEDPKTKEIVKPMFRGRDISRYSADFADLWLISTFPSLKLNIDDYPAIKNHLESFGKKLEQTGESYFDENGIKQKSRKKTNNQWFETQDSISYCQEFINGKIFYREIGTEMDAIYSDEECYVNNKIYMVTGEKLKYLLSYFNSKLFNKIILSQASALGGKGEKFLQEVFVIRPNEEDEKIFNEKADLMLNLHHQFQTQNTKFIRLMQRKFVNLEKLPKKLEAWYELTFADFVKELAKKKNKLSLQEEIEWEEIFEQYQQPLLSLQEQIQKTDREIDQMVYALYGLTEEEIALIESV